MISIECFPEEKVVSVPRDATAFYQRGRWIDWHGMVGWGQRSDLDSWVSGWCQRLVDRIVQLEKEDDEIPAHQKAGGRYGYWYTGDGVDRKQLFGTNYEKLRVLKKKYDPDMVFHSWYPITPSE
jgi:Berberine and berberine like